MTSLVPRPSALVKGHRVFRPFALLLLLSTLLSFGVAGQLPTASVERRLSEYTDNFEFISGPSVAVGDSYVVFWIANRSLYSRRVNSDGQPVTPPRLLRPSVGLPAVASDGESVLVLTTVGRSDRTFFTVAETFSSAGEPVAGPIAIEEGVAMAVKFDGRRYVAVFSQADPNTGRADLRLATLSKEGRLLQSREVDLPDVNAGSVSLATNGFESLVAWRNGTGLRMLSFDAQLNLTRFRGEFVTAAGEYPSVVWTGSAFTILWSDLLSLYSRQADLVSGLGEERVVVHREGAVLMYFDAVWDGRYTTVVVSSGFSGSRFYASRLDRFGVTASPLDGVPVGPERGYFVFPHLASSSDGQSLLTYYGGAGQGDTAQALFGKVLSSAGPLAKGRAVRR